MRLTLTVVDPRNGDRADVVLDAEPETPAGAVAHVLERQLGASAGGSRSIGDESAPPLFVDGRAVDTAVPLARSPLREGAVVSLYTPAGCPPREVTGIVELRVSGGPGAGAVHRLGLGRTDIGSGPADHVRIPDPELPERALTFTVGPDGRCRVQAHVGDDQVTLDGLTLRQRSGYRPRERSGGAAHVDWPLSTQLSVGGTLLELVGYTPPDAVLRPTEDGTGYYVDRPPRLMPPDRWTGPLLDLSPDSGLVVRLAHRYRQLLTRDDRRPPSEERRLRTAEAALRTELTGLRIAAPSPAAVLSLATGPRAGLWERRRSDDDHLLLRVGTDSEPSQTVFTNIFRVDDVHYGSSTHDVDVPVTLPLRELGVIGMAGPDGTVRALGRWAVAQTAALHSPLDARIHVLTEHAARESWDWLRWLPHARPFAGQGANVLIGADAETIGTRVSELTAILDFRLRSAASNRRQQPSEEPDIVVVWDNSRRLRSMPGVVRLLREGPAVSIYAICLDSEERFLPGECRAVVVAEAGSESGAALRLRVVRAGGGRRRGVRPDVVSAAWCTRLARALAPLRNPADETTYSALPDACRLLDVLALEPPTGDAIATRWREGGGQSTLAVIGESYDGPFRIDLRRDGQHGLIAGATGSGKSELLQTIVASLAVANTPENMNFLLVDYKGGSVFRDCVRLPHTVGMITDLAPHLAERALTSLGAELERRERILASAAAKDIEDYQDLVRRDPDRAPLPRLLIVIDEFASLVRDLPEFLTGLVRVGQRGRSLGIHLLLATQRPSGVISPEIAANTNLRIALRVTDSEESVDVIGVPDAGEISKDTPGRGYVRLGHTSVVPFQSARVGGHRPGAGDPALPAPWASPLRWADLGRPVPHRPTAAGADGDDRVSDLRVLVQAVCDAARALDVPRQHSPWLPPLPDTLLLDEIQPPTVTPGPGVLPPVAYGVADLPAEQERRPVIIDFEDFGHLLVAGAPRSGRSQLLRTIAGSLARAHSWADVHLYGIDCGNGALNVLTSLPHCGAVVGRNQTERVERLMARLSGELTRRQEILAGQGFADIGVQRAVVSEDERLPHIMLLLDRWEGWLPTLGELNFGVLTDQLMVLMREGVSVGIHVVLTGDRVLLSGRIASLTEDKYGLRLADHLDYSLLGLRPRTMPDEIPPGRGFRAEDGTETQFALLGADPSGRAQAAALSAIAETATARDADLAPGRRPFRIDVLPARITFPDAWEMRDPQGSRSRLWGLVGLGGDELMGLGPDLAQGQPTFVVAGPRKSGRSTALMNLARSYQRQGTRLVIVTPFPSPLRDLASQEGVLNSFGEDVEARELEQAIESAERSAPIAVLVDDADSLRNSDAGHVFTRIVSYGAERGLSLVIAGDEEELSRAYAGWLVAVRKGRRGLLLSPQIHDSGDLTGIRTTRSMVGGPVTPGRGLLHLGDGRLITVTTPL
ncbi:FtsK/SpoIIIE domain-containing protein [Streptomyces sp. NPDC001797]|uniref:FtsK/SpoIIIE domain-containing protein n=1 Tax=Streptomyces sp. NPDC001797 TaxID=3364610 RepID=UPI0036A32146